MKRCVISIAIVGCSLATDSGLAQTPQPQQPVREARVIDVRQAVLANVEARTTTGRPYSAEAVTETTQTLFDGNRIERSTTVRIYRDSQGRTRREQLTGGTVRSISISDPVGQVSYSLDPEKKTARRSGVAVVAAGGAGFGGRGRGGADAGATTVTSGTSVRVLAPQGPVIAGMTPTPASSNVKKEELPPQNIEGLMARGERTTTVIPAGSIGNVNDIKIVSEQWFSDDLQVLVMTKHSDPRSGETIYRLRNIVRAEPDASLFVVPPDYTIVTGGGGRDRGGQ